MAWLDRAFSILLIVAGIVHAVDSFSYYYRDELTLLWAVCGALFVILIGAINLLRASRPADYALAWICLVSALAWIGVVICFGHITLGLLRVHILIVLAVTVGMFAFSVRTIVARSAS